MLFTCFIHYLELTVYVMWIMSLLSIQFKSFLPSVDVTLLLLLETN